MASSNTDGSEAGGRTETAAGPVDLERTITYPDGGVVATFVLSTMAAERTWVRLEQPLPEAFTGADVGFRKDAAPAEWSVEDGLVRGTGAVPADGSVEFVLGLKLSDRSTPRPSFPEPELTPCDEPEDPERAETAGPLEREDMQEAVEERDHGTAATDGGTDTGGGTDTDGGTDAGARASGAEAGGEDDESPVLGNPDGELAQCIREVVEDDGTEDAGASAEADTEDDGPPAPAPDGDGLEAAVAAVETELDEESNAGEAEDEPPELDLQPPATADEATAEAAPDDTGERDENDDEEPADIDIATTAPDADDTGSLLTIDSAEEDSGVDGSDTDRGGSLVEEIERADDAQRERIREALGIAPDGTTSGETPETGTMGEHGALDVRLRNVESRLSAFEAYEDALEGFIEDTGTVEEIGDRAAEAAEAATELREELAGLREEIDDARAERETLREELQATAEEREALREEVTALREGIDEVRGLRQQLLGALKSPGGAEAPGATVSGDD